jgi:hypothetical protein
VHALPGNGWISGAGSEEDQKPIREIVFPTNALALIVQSELMLDPHSGVTVVNRPGFTGGQNSRRVVHYGTDTQEEDREALFPRVPRTSSAAGDGTPR